MSRNRGKRKAKLRDFSVFPLTREEKHALQEAIQDPSPIATAILGAVMVEHELEDLLRARFLRRDDETWMELVSDTGPLSTFYRKIVAGYAFKIYDDTMADNLHVVRNIRNAFAHSKKLIDFDNPLVQAELKDIRVPNPGRATKRVRRGYSGCKNLVHGSKDAYVGLCYLLTADLMDKGTRSLQRRTRRLRKRTLRSNPFSRALFGSLARTLAPPGSVLGFSIPFDPGAQAGGPTPEAPKGLLGALFETLPASPHKKGK